MADQQPERRKAPRDGDPQLRGRRSEGRATVVVPASLEAISGQRRITLLDVSLSGARLGGAGLPDVGKDIVLRCGAIDTFGAIVWAAPGRCGVHFDEPISPSELIALRQFAAAAEDAGMSPEEIQAAADWVNGLAR